VQEELVDKEHIEKCGLMKFPNKIKITQIVLNLEGENRELSQDELAEF
jgi:hypothetical protein